MEESLCLLFLLHEESQKTQSGGRRELYPSTPGKGFTHLDSIPHQISQIDFDLSLAASKQVDLFSYA
jgi:hypothetical protein